VTGHEVVNFSLRLIAIVAVAFLNATDEFFGVTGCES